MRRKHTRERGLAVNANESAPRLCAPRAVAYAHGRMGAWALRGVLVAAVWDSGKLAIAHGKKRSSLLHVDSRPAECVHVPRE